MSGCTKPILATGAIRRIRRQPLRPLSTEPLHGPDLIRTKPILRRISVVYSASFASGSSRRADQFSHSVTRSVLSNAKTCHPTASNSGMKHDYDCVGNRRDPDSLALTRLDFSSPRVGRSDRIAHTTLTPTFALEQTLSSMLEYWERAI